MNDAVNIPTWVWVLLGYLASRLVEALMQLVLAPLLQKLRGGNPPTVDDRGADSHCMACKESIDRRIAAFEKRTDDRLDNHTARIDAEIRSKR